MKGYDGLETNPPEIMKEIPIEKYKDLNYDKISPGLDSLIYTSIKLHSSS